MYDYILEQIQLMNRTGVSKKRQRFFIENQYKYREIDIDEYEGLLMIIENIPTYSEDEKKFF